MRIKSTAVVVALLLLPFLFGGCSQSHLQQGEQALAKQNYQQALDYLKIALQEKPGDARIMSALGRAYYHQGNTAEADKLITAAHQARPNDPVATLYRGMIAESNNDFASAEKFYRFYLENNRNTKATEPIRGRLLFVQNENLRRQVADAVKQEKQIGAETPDPRTIGVLPFAVHKSADETSRSLAAGLQAITWYDLSAVKELQLVERQQFQYLVKELQLAEKGFVANGSEPRLGKLVRAGKLVNGSVDKPSDNSVSLSSALVNTSAESYMPTFSKDDDLKRIMRLQKEMVLSVLDSLGIEMKGSRRQALKKPQTENYEAFLAFCQGIELHDRGEFDKAKASFERAERLDPNFGLAGQLADESGLIDANSGPLSSFSVGVIPTLNFDFAQTQFDPTGDINTISAPTTDPRVQDTPQQINNGSATVSGSIR